MNWLNNLPERIRTVLIYAPIPILLVIINYWTAAAVIGVTLAYALIEWRRIVIKNDDRFNGSLSRFAFFGGMALYALALVAPVVSLLILVLLTLLLYQNEPTKKFDLALGLFLPVTVAVAIFALREAGLAYLFFVVIIASLSDSAAYFVGKAIGSTPFAPKISPNKTWEGAIGGWVFAIIGGLIYAAFFLPALAALPIVVQVLLYGLLSLAGQLGDLSESALKRKYGVKDSGTIFPGHGGVLDRFDAFAYIAVLVLVLTWIVN